jgi:CHAD domain-containing protein
MLAPIRDAQMLVQTVSKFNRHGDNRNVREFDRLVGRNLLCEWRKCQRRGKPLPRVTLRKVQHRLECASTAHWDRKNVYAGPANAYKRCRKSFRHVQKKVTDGRLHEWRKQVKYFVYQLEALTCERGQFALEHQRSSRLADRLGSDHDLAVLMKKGVQLAPSRQTGIAVARGIWTRRITSRRAHLQEEAQIYAEKPTRFKERLERASCIFVR